MGIIQPAIAGFIMIILFAICPTWIANSFHKNNFFAVCLKVIVTLILVIADSIYIVWITGRLS